MSFCSMVALELAMHRCLNTGVLADLIAPGEPIGSPESISMQTGLVPFDSYTIASKQSQHFRLRTPIERCSQE